MSLNNLPPAPVASIFFRKHILFNQSSDCPVAMTASNLTQSGDEDEAEEVRVNFILESSVKDRSLEVPSEPIAIPSQIRRKGLSAVINHLLGRKVENESDEEDDDDEMLDAMPFDFLIKGKLLRTGVETAARRYGLSLEESIEIRYFPAQKAPEGGGEGEPLPDWVSGIELFNENRIVATVSYDGNLRLHQRKNGSEQALETIISNNVHTGPIKCLSASPDGDDESSVIIATGSLDQTLMTHKYNVKTQTLAGHARYINGHKSAISCVSTRINNLLSGDSNGGICLWNTKAPSGSETGSLHEAPNKKRKAENSQIESYTITPDVVIPFGHTSQISGITWHGEDRAITGSWDHSVKVWDLESQDCLLTLNGSRVISCLDLSTKSPVVATGHPDSTIRLWDIRTEENAEGSIVTDSTLKPSHKAWISAVKWSPKNPYVLASASHDGTLKIWDIRSSLPLHTVRTHSKEEKSLCLAFGDDTIYTGGTDCIIKQYLC